MRKIELEIRRFVYKVNPKIRVVFHDNSMESDSLNGTIFLNIDEFLYLFDDEKAIKQVLKENGMIFDVMLPTFMVLHEIGHVQTIKKYRSPIRQLMLYSKGCDKLVEIGNPYEKLKKYYQLKLEKDANNYAYNFYLHNYNFVKQFDEKIRAML